MIEAMCVRGGGEEGGGGRGGGGGGGGRWQRLGGNDNDNFIFFLLPSQWQFYDENNLKFKIITYNLPGCSPLGQQEAAWWS